MPPDDMQEQLTKYLTDAHSIELQALGQMKAAPKLAGTDELARIYEQHEGETEEHKRLVEERLEARGASTSKLKDAAGAITAEPVVLVARTQADSPRKTGP